MRPANIQDQVQRERSGAKQGSTDEQRRKKKTKQKDATQRRQGQQPEHGGRDEREESTHRAEDAKAELGPARGGLGVALALAFAFLGVALGSTQRECFELGPEGTHDQHALDASRQGAQMHGGHATSASKTRE